MASYQLSPAAQGDVEEIWEYSLEQWGVEQAEDYLRTIDRAIARIAESPRIGRSCDEIRPGYRKFAVGSHLLFYRLMSDHAIDVVRILHQRMDIDRPF